MYDNEFWLKHIVLKALIMNILHNLELFGCLSGLINIFCFVRMQFARLSYIFLG